MFISDVSLNVFNSGINIFFVGCREVFEKGYIRIFHEIYDEIESQVGMSWIKEVTVDHDEK